MQHPEPEYQPRLSTWSHVWRLVVMLAVSGVTWGPAIDPEQRIGDWFVVLDVVLGAVAYVLVFFRRRRPVAVAIVLGLTTTVSGIAGGPALLALVSVATRRRGREIGIVASVGFACAQQYGMVTRGPDDSVWLVLVLNAIATGAAVGWGLYLGSRRELLWGLRNRVDRAEAEQALRIEQARANERQRIAREMHDVLAHRISQISMHAGALGFRQDLDAGGMRASVAVIQEKAHEALADLRAVLGVLRESGGELAPQPTYADLPGLLVEARAAGTAVEVDDRIVDEVPDVLGRTVYRIVQEGVTNARKHAPGQRLSVVLHGAAGERLDVTMRNPLPAPGPLRPAAPGAGLGLVGMSERAELAGGGLEHRVEGRDFVLHAWIAWPA
ncbi:Signal transduction histidine kinase [Nocardioides terrae]|uniref:histidine kinase n=1 Tax=Nocardioides terrae TaxID=574651 RepID=A0A1I1MBI4_9ACTN|nr:histidine kinase [Nocardioides terrae]SFC82446.1 Signal transduction histidine kinase [Nocardioides terrae]